MRNTANANNSRTSLYELRLITKAIAFLALLTGVLYLRVAAAEVLANMSSGEFTWKVALMVACLLSGVSGLAIAWFRDGIGGLLSLLGGAGLALIEYGDAGRNQAVTRFLYSSPFVVAGALCLVCWWRRRASGQHPG